ncbi:DUF1592 domain-containing protein [Rhodopirellula halodulae]|uniref:DUF1592 domain-containing protein n=1 Tax=Rhodopirellula halodulae TaxID=2894198 RepID=UPI001E4614BE|nr:DUF1592 domain-containing protein [Rhodopirellula sp. JC737]MCC9657798.1 DUF1592 domain-containing protein [Rhodopirellula sp. JC737]
MRNLLSIQFKRRYRCAGIRCVAAMWIAFLSNAWTGSPVHAEEVGTDPSVEPNRELSIAAVFEEHCVMCHDQDDDPAAGVSLNGLRHENMGQDLDRLQRLIEVLDRNEMPPEDEPPLPQATRTKLLAKLTSALHDKVAETHPVIQTPIRRMNRFQYNNAVMDLFELKCIVFTLPERMLREHRGYFQPQNGKMPDEVFVGSRPLGKSQMIEPRLAGVAAFPQDLRAEHGYDNQADHLSLSPLLMESFLKLGTSITESPDFHSKNVGVWNWFFREPEQWDQSTGSTIEAELRPRMVRFLHRAFRGQVTDVQVDRYTQYAVNRVQAEDPFVDIMKSVAAAVISSPRFLYLYGEVADDNDSEASDFELASRLSFFLWGSLPDSELLQLAEAGTLHEPDVLNEQFDRMIRDRRLKRFCDSFPAQWLQLDRIVSSVPDREQFPQFYFLKYRDSMHMMLEPLLLFETVLIENQPITQLLDSDFTYRSDLLENAYGELATNPKRRGQSVTAIRFRRMPIKDRRTGGVITNAAVMTMTSGPQRTQPITRGAWMAGVIFNNPPEPPPADVPALDEKPPEGEEHLTLRERLAMHRQRSDCKGCHEKIDPLGFALENYNPIGTWREQYENGREVDMAGTLFRKHSFADVVEFKDALLAEKDRFTEALAGHLLTFALARPLGPTDKIAVENIAAATIEDEYRMQTLLRQVVLSEPFCSSSQSQREEEIP